MIILVTHEHVRPVYCRQLGRVATGREKAGDTHRGDFAAEAEVVNWRRKEAMWSLFEQHDVGWQLF
jgi:hypothetical protein